jgi:hypothetical protein
MAPGELTSSMHERMQKIRDRNFFTRNFRPVSDGGIRSSSFTLITGTIGAGILSLPKVASYFGLMTSCLFIIGFGVIFSPNNALCSY